MRLTELSVEGFRNLAPQTLAFSDGLNILTGPNAQGKTNLLEAIFLCCTGRSHRTSRDRELIAKGGKCARVDARCLQRDGQHEVEVSLRAPGRKAVRINGSPLKRLGDLMGHMNCVIFSPEDLSLIKDGPAFRRRFLDMTLSQVRPSYFFALQRYQAALAQRNTLLKLLQKQGGATAADGENLGVWEALMAEAGAALTCERARFCDRLQGLCHDLHHRITGGKEDLSLRYVSAVGPEGDVAAQLMDLWAGARAQDLRLGASYLGPHRDDLKLSLDGVDVRAYGSQGQQRTAALSLKLSQLGLMEEETGETPILLLDDVFSELDGSRRSLLAQAIGRVQTILTCVDIEASLAGRLSAGRLFDVSGGVLTQRDGIPSPT